MDNNANLSVEVRYLILSSGHLCLLLMVINRNIPSTSHAPPPDKQASAEPGGRLKEARVEAECWSFTKQRSFGCL